MPVKDLGRRAGYFGIALRFSPAQVVGIRFAASNFQIEEAIQCIPAISILDSPLR